VLRLGRVEDVFGGALEVVEIDLGEFVVGGDDVVKMLNNTLGGRGRSEARFESLGAHAVDSAADEVDELCKVELGVGDGGGVRAGSSGKTLDGVREVGNEVRKFCLTEKLV
jgi:hypothetical protein